MSYSVRGRGADEDAPVATPVAIATVFRCARVFLPVVHVLSEEQVRTAVAVAVENGADGVFLSNGGDVMRDWGWAIVASVALSSAAPWIGVACSYLLPLEILECANRARRAALGKSTNGFLSKRGCLNGVWSGLSEISRDHYTHGWLMEQGLLFGGGWCSDPSFETLIEAAQWKVPKQERHLFQPSVPDVFVPSPSTKGNGLSVENVKLLRRSLDGRSLALSAGITVENVAGFLPYADAFLVAGGIESSAGVFDRALVKAMADTIHAYQERGGA